MILGDLQAPAQGLPLPCRGKRDDCNCTDQKANPELESLFSCIVTIFVYHHVQVLLLQNLQTKIQRLYKSL